MDEIQATLVGAGIATLVGLAIWLLYERLRRPDVAAQPDSETVILLKDGRVVDATEDAGALLAREDLHGSTWEELLGELHARFPDMPDQAPRGAIVLTAKDDGRTRLTIVGYGRTVRLRLWAPPVPAARQHRILRDTLHRDRLTAMIDAAPWPVWLTKGDGTVQWHNTAFSDLQDAIGRPLDPADLPDPKGRQGLASRISLTDVNGAQAWYEVTARPLGDGTVRFAKDIGDLVSAELAQRNFVQTLSKTFAHLPIGLAVFDRDRRLVLFNPALIDLTRLQADFLSTRPNLMSFLDQLRERRMMPEPKNYVSWREKLGEMIAAARDDRFCETWTLDSGLTYKVTGRPHPDGAVAFLFEDISAEISLTRRFRSELELTQSVIDSIEDGIAVFSQMGVLTISNDAYRQLWGHSPDNTLRETNIMDATRRWQIACEPTPIWPQIRDFVLTMRERSTWETDIVLDTGDAYLCRVEPVAGGATLLRFRPRTVPGTIPNLPKAASG